MTLVLFLGMALAVLALLAPAINEKVYTGKDNAFNFNDYGIGCTIGNGSVPTAAADYVTAHEYGDGKNHITVLDIAALAVSTVDDGTAGHGGGTKIYTFPKGWIDIAASMQKWDTIVATSALTASGGDAVLDIGLGSDVADESMESLTGTAQDIANKLDVTCSSHSNVDQEAPSHGIASASAIDGSASAVDAYLNVACTAATAEANGTVTFTGKIVIFWRNLGYIDDTDYQGE